MSIVRTGTLETVRDASGRVYYRGKVRLQDGSRARVDIPEPKCFAKKSARNHVEFCQEQEDLHHTIYKAKVEVRAKREAVTAGSAGETCNAWYERFQAYRRREVGSVDDDGWRWAKWIAPHIGPKPIRAVTADDIENIRDALSAAVLAYEASGNAKGEGRLSPKSAQNIWAALTTPMKYASTRKGPREFRVRDGLGNPCDGIPPPRDGESKRRHWLRPHQFTKLITWLAPRDRDWAEAIAIGLYLHLRPGELHELRVKDLDLVAGEVRICRAYDERKKIVKTPKTEEGIRTVTIPSTLLPLLERIARERGAEERVCPIVESTHEEARPKLYRKYLQAAGVDEPGFYVETATHIVIDFRSLRDSGITWRFLMGERAEVVQREAGHEHIATTLGYAKEVQDRRGRYGDPFPALPSSLAGAPSKNAKALSPPVHLPVHVAQKVNDLAEAHGDRTRAHTSSARENTSPHDPKSTAVEHLSTRGDVALPRVAREVDRDDIGRLTLAIERASGAGQWAIVELLGRQLEALTRGPNVVSLEAARRTRR